MVPHGQLPCKPPCATMCKSRCARAAPTQRAQSGRSRRLDPVDRALTRRAGERTCSCESDQVTPVPSTSAIRPEALCVHRLRPWLGHPIDSSAWVDCREDRARTGARLRKTTEATSDIRDPERPPQVCESGRVPEVAMMGPTHHGLGAYHGEARWLHRPRLRAVLLQPQMRSRRVALVDNPTPILPDLPSSSIHGIPGMVGSSRSVNHA